MKILFDQGTPAPLRHALAGHVILTAFEQGWSNLQNGDLNPRSGGGRLPSILPTTSWPKIQKHLDKVAAAVDSLKPGDYRELDFGV